MHDIFNVFFESPFSIFELVSNSVYGWRLKRGTEQVAERRNEGTEQLQIVEEPVMNGTRVQRGTELMNNLLVGLKRGTDLAARSKTRNGKLLVWNG